MLLPEIFTLGSSFKKYFEIVPAYTDELKTEAFRVRHQVYCKDLKFESERSSELETDEYDTHSLHLLIRFIKTNEFVGCTRIILPQPGVSGYSLPFEEMCASTLDQSIVDSLPRNCIGEVSRLAVISRFRRRRGDMKASVTISDEDYGTVDQPRFPFIPIGLYIGTIELARKHGINYLFMLTEKRLACHFERLGANVQFIGDSIDHRGKRIPSMLNIDEIISNMRLIFRPLYRAIAADIKKNSLGAQTISASSESMHKLL